VSRLVTAAVAAATLGALAAPSAFAAANPSGTGQPNQSCEEQPAAPPGFSTGGFVHAQTVYAGAGVSAGTAGSPNAVSQYDVACFQVSSR
jgi:hypothetical protein